MFLVSHPVTESVFPHTHKPHPSIHTRVPGRVDTRASKVIHLLVQTATFKVTYSGSHPFVREFDKDRLSLWSLSVVQRLAQCGHGAGLNHLVQSSKSESNSGWRSEKEVEQGILTPHPSAEHLYVWVGEEGGAELTLNFFTAVPWACPGETPSRCAKPRTSRYDSQAIF